MIEVTEAGPETARRGEAALKVAGLVVAVGLAAVSALYEAFLTPLAVHWTSGGHAHALRLPLAVALAVLGNAALTWFTRQVTDRVLAVLLPFVAWTAPMLVCAAKTREGDLVLTGDNWVGLVTMFAGAMAFAITAYWLVMRSLRRPL